MAPKLFLVKVFSLLFNEKKIRIYGPLVFGIVLFAFFQLPVLMIPHKFSYVVLRMLGATIIWVVSIWVPTRFVILQAHKRLGAQHQTRRRIITVTLIIVPLTALISILRIYFEHYLLWELPVHEIPFTFSYIGTSLLFVIAEIAFYETTFYLEKWHHSAIEMRELKKANLQLQYDSLKGQIQPHFLFNTLNTLIGLMKTDIPKAVHFTEEMARVYRYLLQANDRQFISLSEEMKFTQAYFFMLKTRYSEGLHLEAPDQEEMDQYVIPPLSLQILLENAVKHNIITRERPLYISIQFDPSLKQLVVSNNLQHKPQVFNTGLGLIHLKKKFELLHISPLIIDNSANKFSVTLPLLKSYKYESSYN